MDFYVLYGSYRHVFNVFIGGTDDFSIIAIVLFLQCSLIIIAILEKMQKNNGSEPLPLFLLCRRNDSTFIFFFDKVLNFFRL
jgi:hypothetical protein